MSKNLYIKPTIASEDDSTLYFNTLSTTPGGEVQITTTGETVNTIGPDRHIVVGDVLVSPGHYKVIPSDYHIDGNLTIEGTTGITIGTETIEYDGHIAIAGEVLNCTGVIDVQGGLSVGTSTFTISNVATSGTSGTSGSSGTSGTSGTSLPVTNSLIAHYMADAGVTTAGDGVTSWADQSPNSFNLSAPTGSEPDAIGVTLNGINIPNTNTNYPGKYMVTPTNITQMGSTGTIFIVAAQYASEFGYGRFIDSVFTDNFHFSRNSENLEVLGGIAANDFPYGAVLGADNSTFNTFRLVFNGTTTVITKNGTDTSEPYTNGTPGSPQPLAVFATTTGSFYGRKAIAELIIYDDVLGTSDIEAVENYLVAKWAHY